MEERKLTGNLFRKRLCQREFRVTRKKAKKQGGHTSPVPCVTMTACMGTTMVVLATPRDTRCLLLFSSCLGGEIEEISLDHCFNVVLKILIEKN